MRDSTYKFSLDIHDVASQVQVTAKQNDNARKIVATLMENGKPYALEVECRAVMMIKKPDGNILYNDCEVIDKGCAISYDFTSQTTAVVGIHECELRIYGADNEIITSPRFTILVCSNVYQDGQISSTSEYTALTGTMSDIAVGIATINQAVSDVNDGLEDINEALERETEILDKADTSVTNAEAYATTAQGYANAAEGYKNAAATSETNAKTSEDNAKDSEDNAKAYKEAVEDMFTNGIATTSKAGIVKPDGTTISVSSDGTISATTSSLAWGNLTGDIDNQTDLKTALDGKADSSHTHTKTDIADFAHNHNDLYYGKDDVYTKTEIDGKKATRTDLGFIKPDNTTTFVDADGVLSAVGGGGGGGGVWGSITGDIFNQTDLQTALSGKANASDVYTKTETYTKTEVDGLIPSPYSLPTASTTTLGGVKVDGTTISIDGNGVISGSSSYTLPTASASTLGGIKVGTNLTIEADGTVNATGGSSITGYGKSLEYDEDSSELSLKDESGNVLSTVTIEGGSTKSVINVTTEDFMGQTVTCSNGIETLTSTFDSSGTAVFKTSYVSEYTITCSGENVVVDVETLGGIYTAELSRFTVTITVSGNVTLAPEMASNYTVPSGYYRSNSVNGFQVQLLNDDTVITTKSFSNNTGSVGLSVDSRLYSSVTLKYSDENGFTTPQSETLSISKGDYPQKTATWVEKYSTLNVTTEEATLLTQNVTVSNSNVTLVGLYASGQCTFILKEVGNYSIVNGRVNETITIQYGETVNKVLSSEYDVLKKTTQSNWGQHGSGSGVLNGGKLTLALDGSGGRYSLDIPITSMAAQPKKAIITIEQFSGSATFYLGVGEGNDGWETSLDIGATAAGTYEMNLENKDFSLKKYFTFACLGYWQVVISKFIVL